MTKKKIYKFYKSKGRKFYFVIDNKDYNTLSKEIVE